MVKCSKCGIEKHEDEYSFRNKSLNKKHPYCKECQKKMTDNHYNSNKNYYKQRNINRKIEFREWIDDLKSSLKCEHCGENHPATLDFHHSNPNEKENNISNMVKDGFSKENILKEMKKCIILCSNCHRKLHWEQKV